MVESGQQSKYSDWLWAGRSGVQIPAGVRHFSLLQNVWTSSGAHPAPYSMGSGVHSFKGVEQTGHKVNHLLLPSAEIKNEWSYTYTPSI